MPLRSKGRTVQKGIVGPSELRERQRADQTVVLWQAVERVSVLGGIRCDWFVLDGTLGKTTFENATLGYR